MMDVHLNDTLQSLPRVLAEESQENKRLSLSSKAGQGRQTECHRPCPIDLSAADAKEQSPEGREGSQMHRLKEV